MSGRVDAGPAAQRRWKTIPATRRSLSRRGSYFFVIDAFIAAAILAFTLMLIFNFYAEQRQSEQTFTYAQDYLNFLTRTAVRDYHTTEIATMIANGTIKNSRISLAQQVLLFNYSHDNGDAEIILDRAAQSLPATIDLQVSITNRSDSWVIYSRNTGIGRSDASTHLVAKNLVYTLIGQSTIYGPFVMVVEVWL